MLYQQGSQKIEVVVRREGKGSNQGAKNIDAENSKDGEEEESGKLTAKQKHMIKTNLTHIYAASIQIAGLSINHIIGGIGLQSGDKSLQEQVQRNMEIFTDVQGTASSTMMGMVFGAKGGPIGMAVGGVLGLATSLTSTIVKYAGRQRDYDYKVFKENNAIEYKRARASINLTTGRLR